MNRAISTIFLCAAAMLVGNAAQVHADTIFTQDFESGLGVLESTGGAFAINNTGFGNNGTMMMGHAVSYGDLAYAYYEISGLDLSGFANILLSFDFQASFELRFDGFNVLVSTSPISPPAGLLLPTLASEMQYLVNGLNNPNLGDTYYDSSVAAGGPSGVAQFDLSSFAGSTVNIRLQFGSDEDVSGFGINFDNILISGDVVEEPPTEPPTNPAPRPVPEPSALLVWGIGAACMLQQVAARRRRRNV